MATVSAQPATRRYRGESAEDRRAARRERLLAAGLELLGSEGLAGTTVRGVCQSAQLTPRFFYESFEDLDALLIAVFDGVIEQASAEILAAVESAPDDSHAKARAAIETFVAFITEDPRRVRIAFVEALGSERLMRRRLDAMHMFSQLVAVQGGEFYGFDPRRDPLVELTASVLVGGMAELLIRWLDGSLKISRERLITDFTELFVATGETAVAIARRRAGEGRP
jgi:AcrR family transcriptional regulator